MLLTSMAEKHSISCGDCCDEISHHIENIEEQLLTQGSLFNSGLYHQTDASLLSLLLLLILTALRLLSRGLLSAFETGQRIALCGLALVGRGVARASAVLLLGTSGRSRFRGGLIL